ncbi:MAG: hypothetical protein GY810_03755 [Aureispira sp.]|nr:hypothetical protein [Aureispira sp.]
MQIFFWRLLLCYCICFNSALFAQNNQAVVWRGFEHSWTYNHRINRLGNYITQNNNKLTSCHASASGLGADSTTFTSHYSFVKSPNVAFQAGKKDIKLYGKEKHLITKIIEIAVPAKEGLKNKDEYITLLNGFDLRAVDRADKIQLLRLSVENAEYAPAVNEIRFYLRVTLVVNCQSFECSRFNQKTTYNLSIHYLIAAGDTEYLTERPKMLTKDYPWGKKDEHHHTSDKRYIIGKKDGEYQNALLGIKSMALTLDDAHWTVEYHNNITPLDYNKETGRLDFAADLFFKEWQQGMKTMSAKPQHSKFSSKKKGWCVLDVGISLLQFKEAEIVHKKHGGSMFWEGFNAPSSDGKAMYEQPLVFPFKTTNATDK